MASRCWTARFGDLDVTADAQVAGATSLDLLGLELDLRRETGHAVSLESIEGPVTLEAVRIAIESAVPIESSGVTRDAAATAPATAAQASQWLAERLRPSHRGYLVPLVVDLPSDVSWSRLSEALAAVEAAHPALRTIVRSSDPEDPGTLAQVVARPLRRPVVEPRSVVGLDDAAIRRILDGLSASIPGIGQGRPWRAFALQVGGRSKALLLLLHHAAVDDPSLRVLVDDLGHALEGRPLAAEQRTIEEVGRLESAAGSTPRFEVDLAWWRERLADVPPRLALPAVSRPVEPVRRSRRLDPETRASLDEALRRLGSVRNAAVVQAARKALQVADLDVDDVAAIGMPMSLRDHPGLDRTVGMMLNTLPVPVSRADDLSTIAAGIRAARRRRFTPYERFGAGGVRTIPGRTPWLDLVVGVVEEDRGLRPELGHRVAFNGESPFPLLVVVRFDEDCRIEVDADPAWIPDEVAERFVDAFHAHLLTMAWGREARAAVLDGPVPTASKAALPDLVREMAASRPEAIALETVEGRTWTYAELEEETARIARRLAGSSRPVEAPVAILVAPGAGFPLAVLAAMRAGGAAMPIPVETPVSRIASLLERTNPVAVLVDDEAGRAKACAAIRLAAADLEVIDVHAGEDPGDEVPLPEIDPGSACYVLFTSGSTGEPKAVRMHHAGLAGLVAHERRRTRAGVADRTGLCAPLGFDVAFQELFTTWASGGTAVPVPAEVRRDPVALAGLVATSGLTRLHLSPLLLRALAAVCPSGMPMTLREIVVAGETLRIDHAVRRAAASGVRLVNQYGPTETHVATSLELASDPADWPDLPTIGRPIDGIRIRIEDDDGAAVPRGVVGELVIEGDGVALGYLDGDHAGFESVEGRRRYRTGDLARVADDGSLTFEGRRDEQVKVAGYRVEPAEVESVLADFPGVTDAAVVGIGEHGSTTLVAFVSGVPRDRDLPRLRAEVARRLPPWMVPARIDRVGELPRSANGKIDRRALRRRVPSALTGSLASTAVRLDEIVRLLEGAEGIGPDDPRWDRPLGTVGLDSLAAIGLQVAIRRRFSIDVPIGELLECSLAVLVERVRGLPGRSEVDPPPPQSSPSPVRIGDEEWRPLDPIARDVLAEGAMAPEGAFHLAWVVHFPDEPSVDSLKQRMIDVRSRHATLRTVRRPESGERVLPPDDASPVELTEFAARPAEDGFGRLLRHPLRVADGIPWRAATWLRPDGGRDLLVVMHHVSVDGRTAAVILEDLVRDDFDGGHRPVAGSTSADDHADDDWWVSQVRRVVGDDPLPNFEFEPDLRTRTCTDAAASVLFQRSMEHATRSGMPPLVPALLAWGLLLARTAGREHAVIGVPFATDVDDSGLGASMLPVAIDVRDELEILVALRRLADTLVQGMDRRKGVLGRIVRTLEPDVTHFRPPVDGVITRDDSIRTFEDAVIEWMPVGSSVFRAGLLVPSSATGSPVAMEVEPAVLDGETADDFLHRWTVLLEAVVDTMRDSTSRTLGDLDGLRPLDRELLPVFGTGDSIADDADESVAARFLRIAAEDPEGLAAIDDHERITYGELERWSAAITTELVARAGPVAGRSVAVSGDRGIATLASMLAVVRAGGWFVPLDADIPETLRRRQLERSRPIAGIAAGGRREDLSGIDTRVDPAAVRGNAGAVDPAAISRGEDPLYAMFTSGTTGEPKGAVIPHRAVLRLVDDPWFLPAKAGFRMLHAAPLAFDAATLEVWWPLLNGGTVCCWGGRGGDLPGIAARIRRDEVDGAWLTAALFHAAVDGIPELFEGMSIVLTGGDVVSSEHVRRLHALRPDLAVVDGYGPTENTVFTACEAVGPGGPRRTRTIPIGRPVRGTGVQVLDASGRRVPVGRYGELVATGAGVGLGYLDSAGRPERRDGFDLDPRNGEPRYRTGDRVRWRADGRLEFGGRLDGQVKVGGRRIELEAVESGLRELADVLDASATLIRDAGRRRLAAIYVPASESGLDVTTIRRELERRLPAWEVPAILHPVEVVPRTRNGKPDRKRIEALLLESAQRTSVTPAVDVQRGDQLSTIVHTAVAEVAGRPVVDPERPVRELGLDSLDLLRLALQLEKLLARPVSLVDVLEGGSPAAIADRLSANLDRERAEVVTLQPGGSGVNRSLYVIPGVGGTVFSFRSILEGLPSWLPVRGLPYPGTAGAEPPVKRLETLGSLFADRIRRTGPPSVILGYSLGGFAAFEAARRLAADGPPPLVMVIDTTPASLRSRRTLTSRMASARDWKMRIQHVLPHGIVDRITGRDGRGYMLQSLRDVVAAGFDALRHHDPSPAPIDVVVVRTSETDFGPVADVRDLGWGALARRVEVVDLPVDHLQVFRGGSMGLARLVRSVVDRERDGRTTVEPTDRP